MKKLVKIFFGLSFQAHLVIILCSLAIIVAGVLPIITGAKNHNSPAEWIVVGMTCAAFVLSIAALIKKDKSAWKKEFRME